VYLSPEKSRGTVVTHGFHAPQELEKLRTLHRAGGGADDEERPSAAPSAAPRAAAGAGEERIKALESRLADAERVAASACGTVNDLQAAVAELRAEVATLSDQLRSLREALGA
jgi:uncharacterized coiled-coil protein SlyX